MPTKGASYRYGNTNGAHHRGEATQNINYPWAKGFIGSESKGHFGRHHKEFGSNSESDYITKAIHFANEVDRKNYRSVVDYKGNTFKYDPRDGRLVIVTSKGLIKTYHHSGHKFTYHPKKGKTTTIWIKR